MTSSNWITLGVGAYAAIVATIALIWNILRERRKVTVSVNYAFGVGALGGQEMVAIEVINNGLRPINIKEVGFMFSDKTKMINPREPGNLGWLKDGDGTSCYFPKSIIDEVAEEAKKRNVKVVFAYVRDSTNTYYKSKIRKHAMWFNT